MKRRNKLFNFKKEIGWGDIISILALLLAGYTFFHQIASNKAEISFTNDKLISTNFIDFDGRKKLFGFSRATIRNNGNKAVTFIGIQPHESLNLILLSEKNSTKLENGAIRYRIFQIPDSILAEDVIKNRQSMASFKDQGLERLSMINKTINPGEVFSLNIGTVFDVFTDTTKHYSTLVFTSNLVFSDGTKLLFGSAAEDFND